jgi:hypothetical protein
LQFKKKPQPLPTFIGYNRAASHVFNEQPQKPWVWVQDPTNAILPRYYGSVNKFGFLTQGRRIYVKQEGIQRKVATTRGRKEEFLHDNPGSEGVSDGHRAGFGLPTFASLGLSDFALRLEPAFRLYRGSARQKGARILCEKC